MLVSDQLSAGRLAFMGVQSICTQNSLEQLTAWSLSVQQREGLAGLGFHAPALSRFLLDAYRVLRHASADWCALTGMSGLNMILSAQAHGLALKCDLSWYSLG